VVVVAVVVAVVVWLVVLLGTLPLLGAAAAAAWCLTQARASCSLQRCCQLGGVRHVRQPPWLL
jgi:hypothetical protein